MKKFLCLLVYMAIGLTFLAGCANSSKGISAAGTQNHTMEAAPSQPAKAIDWKYTTYDTINNFDGVTMSVKEGSLSSTRLRVSFINNSKNQCVYGEYFLLEKKINGRWYQVPVAIDRDYGFNSIGYEVAPGGNSEWAVDWDWLYGSLDKGEYRIVKDILDFRGSGDYDTYYLASEFTIN